MLAAFHDADRIRQDAAHSFGERMAAHDARIQLMRDLSAALPGVEIDLSSISPFDLKGIQQAHVDHVRRTADYGAPIVVREIPGGDSLVQYRMLDGRHRAMSARANGETTIRAVIVQDERW